MEIKTSDIMRLKNTTGAGIKDCKEALEAASGDFDKAVAALREKGKATAAKKADRIAAEGVVAVTGGGNLGVIVEVNCETDFAAKTEAFVALTDKIAKQIAKAANCGNAIQEMIEDATTAIREKISVRRSERYESRGGVVATYSHFGRIGVMVELTGKATEELAKNIAMHIAAANPQYLDDKSVPHDIVEREREILRNKAKADKKPDAIIERMVDGGVKKFYQENCLTEQAYVRDPSKSVREICAGATIARFVRYELGEGIEKKTEDFAEEVKKASQSR